MSHHNDDYIIYTIIVNSDAQELNFKKKQEMVYSVQLTFYFT